MSDTNEPTTETPQEAQTDQSKRWREAIDFSKRLPILTLRDDTTPTTITIPAGTRCTITLHGDGDTAPPDVPRQPQDDSDDVVPLPPGEAVEIEDWDERWIHAAGKRDVYFQTRYSKYQEWRDSTQPHATIVRRAAAYLNQQRRAERAANKEQ